MKYSLVVFFFLSCFLSLKGQSASGEPDLTGGQAVRTSSPSLVDDGVDDGAAAAAAPTFSLDSRDKQFMQTHRPPLVGSAQEEELVLHVTPDIPPMPLQQIVELLQQMGRFPKEARLSEIQVLIIDGMTFPMPPTPPDSPDLEDGRGILDSRKYEAENTRAFFESFSALLGLRRLVLRNFSPTLGGAVLLGPALSQRTHLEELIIDGLYTSEINNQKYLSPLIIKPLMLGVAGIPWLKEFAWLNMPINTETIPWGREHVKKIKGYKTTEQTNASADLSMEEEGDLDAEEEEVASESAATGLTETDLDDPKDKDMDEASHAPEEIVDPAEVNAFEDTGPDEPGNYVSPLGLELAKLLESTTYVPKSPFLFLVEDVLPGLQRLTHVDFGGSFVRPKNPKTGQFDDARLRKDIIALMALFAKSKDLTDLGIRGLPFSEVAVKTFSRLLQRLSGLEQGPRQIDYIDLQGALKLKSLRLLLQLCLPGLKACQFLGTLDLGYNEFGHKGAHYLSSLLPSLRCLRTLLLGGNNFFVGGTPQKHHLKWLNEAFRAVSPTLQHLELAYNGMTDADLRALAEVLGGMQSLVVLGLGNNQLTVESLTSLNRIAQNPQVQSIIVSGNNPSLTLRAVHAAETVLQEGGSKQVRNPRYVDPQNVVKIVFD